MLASCVSPCRPAREAIHGEDRRPAPHTLLPALQSRYPHPSPTGRPTAAAGVGAEGVGAGVTTPLVSPSAGAPGSGGLPHPGVQPRLGGHHGRRLCTVYRAKRPGSRALGAPTRRSHPHAHPAHASSRSSRHGSGDYRPTKQGGNRAYGRSLATLPVAGFSRPQALWEFSLDPKPQKDQSLHRVSTLQNGDAEMPTSPILSYLVRQTEQNTIILFCLSKYDFPPMSVFRSLSLFFLCISYQTITLVI